MEQYEYIYFDNQTWIDLHEKREEHGKFVKKLMEKIIKENKTILYSDFTIREFKTVGYSDNEINSILRVAKPDHIKRIHRTKDQIKESIKLAKQRKIPPGDAIHAILARDHNAQLVSRDPHYIKIKDITNTKSAKELL